MGDKSQGVLSFCLVVTCHAHTSPLVHHITDRLDHPRACHPFSSHLVAHSAAFLRM